VRWGVEDEDDDARPLSLSKAIEVVAARRMAKKTVDQIEFNPQKSRVLPEPEGRTPTSRRISFARPLEEVRLVAQLLFDDVNAKPSIVGDRCFELQLCRFRSPNDCYRSWRGACLFGNVPISVPVRDFSTADELRAMNA
jgi:hypothetical protein